MNTIQYHCFDVFDTVLTRIWIKPERVFYEMGGEQWVHTRLQAEEAVCRRMPGEEVTLANIYQEIGRRLSWTSAQEREWLQRELAEEEAAIRPLPRQAEEIATIHRAGQNVIFISGMYLPQEFIQRMLIQHRLWEEGDRLYVSCEHGKGKPSGELLKLVLEEINAPAELVTVHGNSILEDIEPARTIGMRTVHVSECEPTFYEAIPEHALFAGISRLARIQHHDTSHIADVIAPTLFFTTLWMLQETQRLGVRRLYFLSRDGYFMYRIAQQLVSVLHTDIELRYLYVSRLSLTQEHAIGYLLQEGIADGTPYAIADIGWLGTIQTSLEQLLEDAGYQVALPVTGLYFCFLGTTEIHSHAKSFLQPPHSKLFEQHAERDTLELLLTAHGDSVGNYEYTDGVYRPIFVKNDTHPTLLTQNVIDTFTYHMITTSLYKRFLGTQNADHAYRLLSTFLGLAEQHTRHRMLNIGCGDRFHPAWINIDKYPAVAGVQQHNIQTGLPYPSSSFDIVYHSHLLEHLTKQEGINFLWECRRILKPGGIIRIAVPDLERLAKNYLASIHQESPYHEWSILALFDQFSRITSGGQANWFIAHTTDSSIRKFLIEQWGNIAKKILGDLPPSPTIHLKKSLLWRIREVILRIILRDEYPLLTIGRFRESGEIHKWMYDRKNLAELLTATSFTEITICTASTSAIDEWASYCLDTEPDGTIVKPDSLYIEAKAS